MIKEFYSNSFFVGKNKFYNIFIDQMLFSSIKEKTYIDLELFKSYKLDLDKLIEKLEDNEVIQAKIKAMELLARSSHFENDLRKKLKDRGYIGYCQDRAIEELKNMRYLDDRQTAENFVFAYKNKSKKFIYEKLKQKNIDQSLIYEVLEEFEENDNYLEIQVQKYSNNLDLNQYKDYQKAVNYFVRKGYDYKKIKTILNNLKEDTYE